MEEKDAELLALRTLRGLSSNSDYFEFLAQRLGDSTNNPIKPKLRRFFASVLAAEFPHLNRAFNDILPTKNLPSEALSILQTYARKQGPETFVREFESHFKTLQKKDGINHVEINELIGFVIKQKK